MEREIKDNVNEINEELLEMAKEDFVEGENKTSLEDMVSSFNEGATSEEPTIVEEPLVESVNLEEPLNIEPSINLEEPVAIESIDNPTFSEADYYNSDEPIDMYAANPGEVETLNFQKKKKPIKLILAILIPLLLIGMAVGGYFLYKHFTKEELIKEPWGQTYYLYLKDSSKTEIGIPGAVKKAKMSFYEIENMDNPIMLLNYNYDNQDYTNVYYINNENVEKITYEKPTTIELLYNIADQKYNYYSHTKMEDKDTYKLLDKQFNKIENNEQETTDQALTDNQATVDTSNQEIEYVFTEGDVDQVQDVDGKMVSVTKFDRTFIKPAIENNEVNYIFKNEEKIKNTVENGIAKYKKQSKLLTAAVKDEVNNKLTELTTKEEQLKAAKEAVEKKQAEEAKKQAEEEAKKGLKVGDFYLKYGKYKSDVAQYELTGGTYTINQDGTFVYENEWKDVSGEIHQTKRNGTYAVKYSEGDQQDKTKAWVITFTTKSSNETNPIQTDTYDVKQNDKFTARQYKNNWSYVG